MGETEEERAAGITELNRVLKDYEINSPKRISGFMGQVYVESFNGICTIEIGDDSYLSQYAYRSDLKNNGIEDALLFRGGGYLQITGRNNYTRFAKYVENPLIADYKNDENNRNEEYGYKLVDGEYKNYNDRQIKEGYIIIGKYAWETTGWFWNEGNASGRSLNKWADEQNRRELSLKINGGYNKLEERIEAINNFCKIYDNYFYYH